MGWMDEWKDEWMNRLERVGMDSDWDLVASEPNVARITMENVLCSHCLSNIQLNILRIQSSWFRPIVIATQSHMYSYTPVNQLVPVSNKYSIRVNHKT